jgi:hypothetical protein
MTKLIPGDIIMRYLEKNGHKYWHPIMITKIIDRSRHKYKVYYIDSNVYRIEKLLPIQFNKKGKFPERGDWYLIKYRQHGSGEMDENQTHPESGEDINAIIPDYCPLGTASPIYTPDKNSVTKVKKPAKIIQAPFKKQPPQVKMIIGNLVKGDVKESLPWRRKLAEAISSGRLAIDKCNLAQWLNNFKVLGKCSASNTSVVLASTSDEDLQRGVSVKIAYKGGDDNSLDIERGFYKIYFDFIQEQFFSPNVVTFYASFSCPTKEFRKIMTKENHLRDLYRTDQILNKEMWDQANQTDRETLEFLVIERTQGKTLHDLLFKLTADQLKSVLFQIIYTFAVFNRLGLRHNDAHLGNIFIDSLDENTPISHAIYGVDKNFIFKIDMRRMVKLFDLDLSGTQFDCNQKEKSGINKNYYGIIDELDHYDLCQNTKLEGSFCDDYGLCNDDDGNQYFDSFLTLGNIWSQLKYYKPKGASYDGEIKFIESHIGLDLLKTNFSFPFHLGKPQRENIYRSYKPHKIECSMDSPFVMLKDSYFESMKIDNDSFRNECQNLPVYHLPLAEDAPNNYWDDIIPDSCFQK